MNTSAIKVAVIFTIVLVFKYLELQYSTNIYYDHLHVVYKQSVNKNYEIQSRILYIQYIYINITSKLK